MGMRVALTGATGFVGAQILLQLLARGDDVKALVRSGSSLKVSSHDNLEIVTGSLEDTHALDHLVDGCDAVIHCAGATFADNDAGFFTVNEQGSHNVAHAAMVAGVRQFVHVSSLAAREPQLSAYAASKAKAEEAVKSLLHDDVWTIIRPPAVYGPGDEATAPLIEALTKSKAILPGTSEQRVSLIYVDDLAQLLVQMTGGAGSGKVTEPDDGRKGGYSWNDMAEIAGKVHGRKVAMSHLPRWLVAVVAQFAMLGLRKVVASLKMLSPGKVNELYHHDWVCRDGGKVLGWKAQTGFETGFANTLNWLIETGRLPASAAGVKSSNE